MRRRVLQSQTIAKVCEIKQLQKDVFSLKVETELKHKEQSIPKAGQFYMLKSRPSRVLLTRPISVYKVRLLDASGKELASHADCLQETFPAVQDAHVLELEFLILQKGEGTEDLCNLQVGLSIDLIGPLGNHFFKPSESLSGAKNSKAFAEREAAKEANTENQLPPSVAIVGGGIGIAPVSGFAQGLEKESYDFYASFKSGTYGIENVQAKNLYITTDDGSVGVHGMLPAVLTADTLKEKKYTLLYACGPLPMLAYLQKICLEAGVQAWLSMEEKMGCGVGACLGCTIKTTEGNRQCCKAGPIFQGDKLIF